jgi:hypothetical protein
MRRLLKHIPCGLIIVLLVFGTGGVLAAEADDIQSNNSVSNMPALRIIDTIPQPGAGIINFTRVHDDTSFAVLIETRFGIDLNDPESIRFLISDGEYGLYERNLNSPAVRVIEVDTDSSPAASVWAVYDRSLEPKLPPVYALETIVQIWVEAEDIYWNEIAVERHEFKIESDRQQAFAFDHLPESQAIKIVDASANHDAGVEVVSGVLTGAKIFYDTDEPLLPAFGSIDEIEPVAFGAQQALGVPLNLMPHTVFNNPVKLYIPFADGTDVTALDIHYFNGIQWLPACDADGNLLPGGEGWMVPGSRVNHPDQSPPFIEIAVYHFSAAQAVVSGSSTTTDSRHNQSHGSGAAVYAECFIDSAAKGTKSGFSLPGLLVLMIFTALILFIFLGINLIDSIRGNSIFWIADF